MKRIQYEIEHDPENKLITFYTITASGFSFSYTFDENRTIQSILNKMETISNQLNSKKQH